MIIYVNYNIITYLLKFNDRQKLSMFKLLTKEQNEQPSKQHPITTSFLFKSLSF